MRLLYSSVLTRQILKSILWSGIVWEMMDGIVYVMKTNGAIRKLNILNR